MTPKPRRAAVRDARRDVLAGLLLCAGLAMAPAALGDGDTPGPMADPGLRLAVAAILDGRFAAALPLLQRYTSAHPDDADGFNWLGYALRRSGDAQAALPYYDRALTLDPRHLGAREYRGEAYLALGRPADAKAELAELERLCWMPCQEQRDLARAIAAYTPKPKR